MAIQTFLGSTANRNTLPDSTRFAIEHAVIKVAVAKGVRAAGNGNESVDNDGYASNLQAIAVAACNDVGKRSSTAIKAKRSGAPFPAPPTPTPGIWTTDLSGRRGYNDGKLTKGDVAGNYTNSFRHIEAAPGAAV
jgi:hypothetical protein